jgi:hypothetical protein
VFQIKLWNARITGMLMTGLLLLLTMGAANAEAKKHRSKSVPTDLQVVGHSDLQGVSALKMFIQEQQGRWYLYLGHASEQGFTIMDVTDPTRPKLLKNVAAPDQGFSGQLEQVGNLTFATIERRLSDPGEAPARLARASFTVWDLTDPVNPQVLQRFADVTGVAVDERKIIYIVDSEGLWVLRKTQPYVPFPYGPNDPYPNGQDLYHG